MKSCNVPIRILRNAVIAFTAVCIITACNRQKDANDGSIKDAAYYLKLGSDSIDSNTPFAVDCFRKAMALSKDSMTYYDAYLSYSTPFYKDAKPDSVFKSRKKLFRYLSTLNDKKFRNDLLARANNSMCAFYCRLGKTDSAIVYGKLALKANQYKVKEPDILINLSDAYKFKGDFANCAFYLRNALSVCDKYHLEKLRFPVYFALGDVYLGLRNFSESKRFYDLAYKDFNSRGTNERMVFCNNLGNFYYYSKNYDKAREWFLKENKISTAVKDDYMTHFGYTNLADVYLHLHQYDIAQKYADKAEKFFQSIKFDTGLFYINAIRIGIALQKGNYAEAKALESHYKDDNLFDPNLVSIRNGYLEDLSVKDNNFKSAYLYLKKNTKINDSIRNDLTQQKIAEISLRYRQDTTLIKKEMLIQYQKAQVKSLKQTSYIWILASILITFVALAVYISLKRKHKMQRKKYIEETTKFRISNIRNRISPHFMFNVLNHEMDGIDEEKRKHFFTLVHLLRRSLDMAEKTFISLSEEINFAQGYLELEGYRAGDNFKMTWNIAPDITPEEINIIPMMLQIPIENAIKHGLAQVEGEKTLTVDIVHAQDGVLIKIEDNGIGYHPERVDPTRGTGTGLKVLRQTMMVLNSQNEHKIKFTMQNKDGANERGAVAKIFIPNNYNFTIK